MASNVILCLIALSSMGSLTQCFKEGPMKNLNFKLAVAAARGGSTTCECPTFQQSICTCVRYGIPYYVEAPFAELVVENFEPVAAHMWKRHPLILPLPYELDEITTEDYPISAVQLMPREFKDVKSEFKVVYKNGQEISEPIRIHYNDANYNHLPSNVLKVYVLIHGWTGDVFQPDITSTRAYLLMRDEFVSCAVITVDWHFAANDYYRQSVANTVVIGREVGILLFKMVARNKMAAKDIHMIGFDMGSHVAAIAARIYNDLAEWYNELGRGPIEERIGRRTGLNPFARHFEALVLASDTDAMFVDIIHTSTARNGGNDEDILSRRFSCNTIPDFDTNNNVGTVNHQVDFYPNNGQPKRNECQVDDYGCVLQIAVAYFKASLRNGYDRRRFAIREDGEIIGYMGIDAALGLWGFYRLDFYLPRDFDPIAAGTSLILPPCVKKPPPRAQHTDDEPNCGTSTLLHDQVSRVYKGELAKDNAFPWAVCLLSIGVKYPKETPTRPKGRHRGDFDNLAPDSSDRKVSLDGYLRTCSGTVIDPHWVLTAAHCFYTIKNKIPIYLVFGSTDCFKPKTIDNHVRRVIVEKRTRPTQNVFFHLKLNPPDPNDIVETDSADIALILLHEPVVFTDTNFINPICWRGAVDYTYEDCSDIVVSGYGLKGEINDVQLTWTTSNIANIDSPRHAFINNPRYGLLSGSMQSKDNNKFDFANFDDVDGRVPCVGDSGSGVIEFHQLNGRSTLIGVLSGSSVPLCAELKMSTTRRSFDLTYVEQEPDREIHQIGTVFAVKVSVFRDWILNVMANYSTNSKPDDIFETSTGALKVGPDFYKVDHLPTPQPPEGSDSLLPIE